MFRKNKQHQQPNFFNSDFLMPEKMRQQLYAFWAHTFRTMVFAHIPEERFAVLYSEKESRPNAPINVLTFTHKSIQAKKFVKLRTQVKI